MPLTCHVLHDGHDLSSMFTFEHVHAGNTRSWDFREARIVKILNPKNPSIALKWKLDIELYSYNVWHWVLVLVMIRTLDSIQQDLEGEAKEDSARMF